MSDIRMEQAIYGGQGAGGYRFLARSPGFRDEWLADAEQLCTRFGERPAGVQCPACVFAQPFGKDQVAVVQVADQGTDDTGRPGALGFHLVLVPRAAYTEGIGDPFIVADRCPPPWQARGELPALSWPAEPLPPRTVAQVQQVLQRPNSAFLLGGAQALVDGGRIVLERPAPDTEVLRGLWLLLPASTRSQLWPASFAFDNALDFHVVVVPRADPERYANYMTEEQAGDYPEGRYELNLQIAAEAGDQAELDRLFARRSSAQTLRLCLVLVLVMGVLALAMQLLSSNPEPRPVPPANKFPNLPPAETYRLLSPREQDELTRKLRELAVQLNIQPLPPTLTAEGLLLAIDRQLGTPPGKDCGSLKNYGPWERQLRVLLWKHEVPGYNDPKYNVSELVERLQKKVVRPKAGG